VTLINTALGGEHFMRYGLTATTAGTSVIAAIGFFLAMRALRARVA
jgi:hypothetical protein